MTKSRLPFLTAFLLIISLQAFSQDPDYLVKKFFAEYQAEGPIKSINNLYATNPWIDQSSEAIQNLSEKFTNLNEELVGKFYSYEPITRKSVGKSFILMSYMMKFDRQPVRVTFEFYKPNDKWITFSFSFDVNIDEELEEAAKIQAIIKEKGN